MPSPQRTYTVIVKWSCWLINRWGKGVALGGWKSPLRFTSNHGLPWLAWFVSFLVVSDIFAFLLLHGVSWSNSTWTYFFQMGGFFLKFVGLDWANFPRLRNNGGARLEFLGVTFFRSTLDPDLQHPHWINPEKNAKFTKLLPFLVPMWNQVAKKQESWICFKAFLLQKITMVLFTMFHQHEKGNLCFLCFQSIADIAASKRPNPRNASIDISIEYLGGRWMTNQGCNIWSRGKEGHWLINVYS